MQGVLFAETAVLVHLEPVRTILLILGCIIISLLALGACQCDFCLHLNSPQYPQFQKQGFCQHKENPFSEVLNMIAHKNIFVKKFFQKNRVVVDQKRTPQDVVVLDKSRIKKYKFRLAIKMPI